MSRHMLRTRRLTVTLIGILMAATLGSAMDATNPPAQTTANTPSTTAVSAAETQQRLLLQSLALEQEVAQEAVRRGLTERLDVQNALLTARRQILVQAVRDDIARSVPTPGEDELRTAFTANTNRWVLPPAYLLDMIPLDAENSNLMAQARAVVTGKPVADAALAPFTNLTALVTQASGRWVTTNDIPESLWVELAHMQAGEVRLFDSSGSPLLVRRGPHRDQTPLAFEQVRGQIQLELQMQKAQQAWEEYVARLKQTLGF